MFENTRWSNPNFNPNYDYELIANASRMGNAWGNFGTKAADIIGRGAEAYAQRAYLQDIMDRYNNAGQAPVVVAPETPSMNLPELTPKEYEELKKKYFYNANGYGYMGIPFDFTYGGV